MDQFNAVSDIMRNWAISRQSSTSLLGIRQMSSGRQSRPHRIKASKWVQQIGKTKSKIQQGSTACPEHCRTAILMQTKQCSRAEGTSFQVPIFKNKVVTNTFINMTGHAVLELHQGYIYIYFLSESHRWIAALDTWALPLHSHSWIFMFSF